MLLLAPASSIVGLGAAKTAVRRRLVTGFESSLHGISAARNVKRQIPIARPSADYVMVSGGQRHVPVSAECTTDVATSGSCEEPLCRGGGCPARLCQGRTTGLPRLHHRAFPGILCGVVRAETLTVTNSLALTIMTALAPGSGLS